MNPREKNLSHLGAQRRMHRVQSRRQVVGNDDSVIVRVLIVEDDLDPVQLVTPSGEANEAPNSAVTLFVPRRPASLASVN
jgi:hypothetical protein